LEDGLFWRVQGSKSECDFDRNIQELRRQGFEKAADYLCAIVGGEWLLYKWVEMGAVTYGWKTSNQAEIRNSTILAERELPPLRLLTSLIFREMHNLYCASERANQWLVQSQQMGTHRGQVMTDHVQKMCTQFNKNSDGWFVREISNEKAVVSKAPRGSASHSTEFIVEFPAFREGELDDESNMIAGTCTCLVPQTQKVYCEHAVAAERASHARRSQHDPLDVRVEDLLMDWVSCVHLISTYSASCDNLHIHPVMVGELKLDKCYPWRVESAQKKTPGPARKKRRDWRWVRGNEGVRKQKGITGSAVPTAHLSGHARALQHPSTRNPETDSPRDPEDAPVVPYTSIDGWESVSFETLLSKFQATRAARSSLCWSKSPAFMTNLHIAHVFVADGWCVGKVKGTRSANGDWDVKYKGFDEVYKHKLDINDYKRVWVVVHKSTVSQGSS